MRLLGREIGIATSRLAEEERHAVAAATINTRRLFISFNIEKAEGRSATGEVVFATKGHFLKRDERDGAHRGAALL